MLMATAGMAGSTLAAFQRWTLTLSSYSDSLTVAFGRPGGRPRRKGLKVSDVSLEPGMGGPWAGELSEV